MSRVPARALVALALSVVVARAALAQRPWNDSTSRQLVERATERRARQLADSGLADYSAQAHGFLTFLAQVGEGFPIPPKVVKADELMLEVYWRAPNYSKQWIVGRRDTLLLPTDINYHRDHLGIVQNNFPDIIRLGDGDEVQDVAHPLSPRGLATYDYQLSDSLRLEIPGRTIDVYEVKIRPRNDREAAAVGAVYIAKDDAQVVRMAFSFTRTALKDQQLEDVSIVIENSLIEGRFWLPRRQEIEIRRTGSWMDFPARGIIRGRWEIRDYRVNGGGEQQVIAASPGPEILYAPSDRRRRFRWPDSSTVLQGLPDDIAVATDDDVRQVQEEARRLVRGQALQRTQSTLPSARSMSDIARVTRAEGLAIGGGIRRRLGSGFDVGVVGRFGLSDHEPKATLSLGWERADGVAVRLSAFREYREAGDEVETSRVRNSIAAQEFGSDYTQPFGTRGAALALHLGTHAGMRWRLDGGYEWQQAVGVAARPSFGAYEPTLAATRGEGPRLSLAAVRPLGGWWWGGTLRFRGELSVGRLSRWEGGGRGRLRRGRTLRARLCIRRVASGVRALAVAGARDGGSGGRGGRCGAPAPPLCRRAAVGARLRLPLVPKHGTRHAAHRVANVGPVRLSLAGAVGARSVAGPTRPVPAQRRHRRGDGGDVAAPTGQPRVAADTARLRCVSLDRGWPADLFRPATTRRGAGAEGGTMDVRRGCESRLLVDPLAVALARVFPSVRWRDRGVTPWPRFITKTSPAVDT